MSVDTTTELFSFLQELQRFYLQYEERCLANSLWKLE